MTNPAAMLLRLASVALLVLSFALSAEVLSFVYLRYVTGVAWAPDFLTANSAPGPVWLTEFEPWGAWHAANSEGRQQSSCFSVALRSNYFGARDRERTINGNIHRTIVLGDSFAEGWGVEAEERLSNILEARLGREFLNFATENDFGPLQYQLIYEQLASRFAHDHVLILFLPDNDFTDNDADYWRQFRPDFFERYRPYYRMDGHAYVPLYPVPKPPDGFIDHRSAPQSGLITAAKRMARENSSMLALYRYLRLRFQRAGAYSGYLDYTPEQQEAVLWSLRRIKAAAGERRVTLVMVPRRHDFAQVAAHGNPLGKLLRRFGHENDITVIDLLDAMPQLEPQIERYFLPCDGHWSAVGNRIAAEALLTRISFDGPNRPSGGIERSRAGADVR